PASIELITFMALGSTAAKAVMSGSTSLMIWAVLLFDMASSIRGSSGRRFRLRLVGVIKRRLGLCIGCQQIPRGIGCMSRVECGVSKTHIGYDVLGSRAVLLDPAVQRCGCDAFLSTGNGRLGTGK